MERLPIKFFSKREEDNWRVEGGGNNDLPSFVLRNWELNQRAEYLNHEFSSILDNIEWTERNNVPAVLEAKINQDALAKSHRGRINKLFSGNGKNNIIGLSDEKTVRVMISNQKTVSEIKKRFSQPNDYAYEISCIEEINKFNPTIVQSKESEDYKVKLINFQNYALNNALMNRFEKYLDQNRIEYQKTRYSSDLEIIKLKNTSPIAIDALLKSEVFDATVFPDTNKETIDEDDLSILEDLKDDLNLNIQEIVRNNCKEIKVWNLSVSIIREITPDKFSDFAIALDSLQDECNILICKSAGNCTNFALGEPIGHLHEGADSVRSLVVGSLAFSSEDGDIAKKNNPSPFSRIGPGPAYIVKPDLVHFGGNACLDSKGNIKETSNPTIGMGAKTIYSSGTSFSTPRIAALAAELTNDIKEDFDPLLIKALILHSCNYPAEINMPINERTKYTGFGKPATVNQILYNSPNEATLILRDTLAKGQCIDIKDFPMPDCLIKNGYYTGQIVATLVYDSILEPSQGFEYCQSNMNLKFGSYDEKKKRDTSQRSILNPVGKEGTKNVLLESFYSKRKQASNLDSDFALKERLLIQYGDKYYPVKKYAVDLSEVTDANREKYLTSDKQWFLYLDGVYRNFSELKASSNNFELNQEFCLIITLRDPMGKAEVYNGVTQKLDEYNFWHSNIKVDTNIVINT